MAPPSAAISRALREAVLSAVRQKKLVTINRARTQVEEDLDLPEGFFKDDASWKTKSKEIIAAAFAEDDKIQSEDEVKTGSKRPSLDLQNRPRKRTKTGRDSSGSNDEDTVAVKKADRDSKSTTAAKTKINKPTKPAKSTKPSPGSNDPTKIAASDEEDVDEDDEVVAQSNGTLHAEQDGDESDMSSLIDEPPPKRRPKKDPADVKQAASKAKKPSTATLSPDEENIKTLQSQLVKCGVRKLWHRELASCNTAKEKIRHLNEMLKDVGMTGRFSAQKAQEIREARELADELQAAQEFSKTWGTEEMSGRARRSRATRTGVVADGDTSEEEDQIPAAQSGLSTGLVDFGDSGDDGSD